MEPFSLFCAPSEMEYSLSYGCYFGFGDDKCIMASFFLFIFQKVATH